jgi:hypothetical protein
MSRLLRFTVLLGCLLAAKGVLAATYYVDYTGGSDSNNGTSKATPWQHAPGMQTCVSVCALTAIKAGESIILKGGETWPNASFMWRQDLVLGRVVDKADSERRRSGNLQQPRHHVFCPGQRHDR